MGAIVKLINPAGSFSRLGFLFLWYRLGGDYSCSASHRSASRAAMQPVPAAEIACR